MTSTIKIAQFGLGPIGLETLKLVSTKPWAETVGAVDIDPAKAGKSLGELTGLPSLRRCTVFESVDDLLLKHKPDLIFHTAVSRFKIAFDHLVPMAQRGINVVSSCEQLLFPQLREPKLASRLDILCRANGARIVAAGVNPGFVMDLLPLFLTGVSREIRAVHIQRVVDASSRRESLQRKIGSGLAPEQFHRLFRAGRAGHAGLKESLALVGYCLGWELKKITETGHAVIADRDIRTQYFEVRQGLTCGLHQRAEGRIGKKVCLTLDLKMYLDAPEPHDAVQIEGEPPIDLLIKGGIAGDQATVAAIVNTASRLLEARPGLLLLPELTLPRFQ